MSRWFWPSVVVGWLLIVFGVMQAFAQPGASQPPVLAAFVIGLLLVHDLVVAPLTCLVGTRTRGAGRQPVQIAMIVSVIVAVFSIPCIAGWGDDPDNPSLLPGNYALGLALILIVTWAITAVALVRAHRARG